MLRLVYDTAAVKLIRHHLVRWSLDKFRMRTMVTVAGVSVSAVDGVRQ